jgi:hypothetical protein
MWTDERVERWLRTGRRPSPVMVWTPEQTGLFLDSVAEDRQYALWHLIAYRGLRRGEACSLDRSELDLARETVTIGTGEVDEPTTRRRSRSSRRTAGDRSTSRNYSETCTRTVAWSSPTNSDDRSTSPRSPPASRSPRTPTRRCSKRSAPPHARTRSGSCPNDSGPGRTRTDDTRGVSATTRCWQVSAPVAVSRLRRSASRVVSQGPQRAKESRTVRAHHVHTTRSLRAS